MNLKNLTIEVRDAMYKAMKEAINKGERYACAAVNTNDGHIGLYLSKSGDVGSKVIHDNLSINRKVSYNLTIFLNNILRDMDSWSEVEDEVKAENAETPEQEYARRGEAMFARSMQWHRI